MSSSPVNSATQTLPLRNYPLNSFSGAEAAIKASALVLAFLCVGGAVATSLGGQFFMPEILMAPIPQIIIESVLGLTSICLLVQVLVLSVKSTSHSQHQADPTINGAKSFCLAELEMQRDQDKATIQELKDRIHQLENPVMKITTKKTIDGLQKNIRDLEREIGSLTTQYELANQRLEEQKNTSKTQIQENLTKIATLEASLQTKEEEKKALQTQLKSASTSELELKMAELKNDNDQLSAAKQTLEVQQKTLKEEHETQLAALKQSKEEVDTQLKTLKEQHAAEKITFQTQITDTQQLLKNEKASSLEAKMVSEGKLNTLQSKFVEEKKKLEDQFSESQELLAKERKRRFRCG